MVSASPAVAAPPSQAAGSLLRCAPTEGRRSSVIAVCRGFPLCNAASVLASEPQRAGRHPHPRRTGRATCDTQRACLSLERGAEAVFAVRHAAPGARSVRAPWEPAAGVGHAGQGLRSGCSLCKSPLGTRRRRPSRPAGCWPSATARGSVRLCRWAFGAEGGRPTPISPNPPLLAPQDALARAAGQRAGTDPLTRGAAPSRCRPESTPTTAPRR